MTEKEIIDNSLLLVVEANKKLYKKDESIGCYDLCHDACEMAEHISYHAIKGVFPAKLFKHRSPNETEKEAEYIKNNYKQYTLPVYLDYLNTISRPFADGNWAIDYKEDVESFKIAGVTMQDYIDKDFPKYGSLENFIKGVLPSIKSIDANGFISVRPEEIEYIQDDQEQYVIDSSKLHEPTIYYFESKNVVDYEDGEWYLFLSSEKSVVKSYGKNVEDGSVYELYTPDAIYFIKQYGLKTDNLFEYEEFFRHNLGSCQVEQLKGIPTLKGDDILWQSPFLYATDLLDLVATNGNFLQALVNSCVFPVKVMFGSQCEFKDSDGFACEGGNIINNGHLKACPSCNGIGLKSRISPLGTLLLNPSTKFAIGEEKSTQDPLKYISPEVHTLEFLDKKINNDTESARKILHLQTSNSNVKGSQDQTATGMAIDVKSMYAFIKPISDQMFQLYEFCLNAIGEQRYGEKFNAPELTYPKTFDFKSSEDYLMDVGNAIKNNLPPSFTQLLLMQYINSYYGDNQKSTGVFKLVMAADRLFGLSQDEINMKLARGTVEKWEDILHTSILNFINDSIIEDAKFSDKPIDAQVVLVQDKAKAIADNISSASIPKVFTTPIA